MKKGWKITGITLATVALAGAALALVVRDQLVRHQRDLFSPRPLRRLACLGHLAREEATVENINLLRDFVAWEPRKLLRNRAMVILQRMEDQALGKDAETPEDRG